MDVTNLTLDLIPVYFFHLPCETQNQKKEWDPNCRQLIFDHSEWLKRNIGVSCRTPCIFSDLEMVIPEGTYNRTDCFMEKFLKVDQAPIFETQHCYTHNCQCKLDKDSHLEVAGLPCWDYSAAGKRRGENGPTIGTFLTHGKRHIKAGTPLIIIENVKELLGLGG